MVELTAISWENDRQVNGVVPGYLDDWPNQTVFIQVRRFDGSLSNPKSISFQGQVKYTCDYPYYLILGSEGSVTDCTPYGCREIAGVLQCLTGCGSTGDCRQGYICDRHGKCVPDPK